MLHTMNNAWKATRAHQRLIVVTFEVFWIVVFLLDSLGRGGGSGVPQFVYVNF